MLEGANQGPGRLAQRRIALGIGGGIAAYKTCDLIRLLQREGASVRVAMTPAAAQFVTPLTLQSLSQNEVLTNYFDAAQETRYGHLHLARWAELFLIAPATADLMSRIQTGHADDAVTTSLLAFLGPVVLAPAMNTAMWNNEMTTAVVAALRQNSRISSVGPEVGPLADGDVGVGRLAELPHIVEAVAARFSTGPLAGKKVLLTAGPTQEPIDAVRFISNASTGKMGFAMAQAARALGASVTVVTGPVTMSVLPHQGIEVISVRTAEEMRSAVMRQLDTSDYFVATAAVSDFRPATVMQHKAKKDSAALSLELARTPDILFDVAQHVRSSKLKMVLVGFAAETQAVEKHALEKMKRKQLDFVVANDVSKPGQGFGSDTNEVMLFSADGTKHVFEGEKSQVAASVWRSMLGMPSPMVSKAPDRHA